MKKIPETLLRQLIPKDGCKITENGFKIKAVNVFSPIAVDELPENLLDLLEVHIDGDSIDLQAVDLQIHGERFPIAEYERALKKPIEVNQSVEFIYTGGSISPGTHQVEFLLKNQKISPISIALEFS